VPKQTSFAFSRPCAGYFVRRSKKRAGWKLEIVGRTQKHVFTVLPERWIVERTFG
jgi:hypothetical protein